MKLAKPLVSAAAVLSGLSLAPAPETRADDPPAAQAASTEPSIPKELQQFSGMLIGKLQSRDIERGEFTVTIQYVARVWEGNKAPQPRSAVGKTVTVEGVTGKWLDNLLLIRAGDTVEFEAQHRGGDRLRFPGEWLRKTAEFNPAEHPSPPDGFRGFSGAIVGRIDAKQEESGELVLEVSQIAATSEKNRAENPQAAVGQKIVLAGFWGKMRQPFDALKAGDTVRTGVLHRVPQSDHFTVVEGIEKIDGAESAAKASPARDADTPDDRTFPQGMEGFRGILRGTVVSRDVEKGELVFRAERVTRTWKQNKASNTESAAGKTFTVQGIAGKWLDVLLTLQPGTEIEVEAFHNRREHLDFVGELLRKVE